MTRFDATSIEEIGRFIDQGRNDFGGVQLTNEFVGGNRVVAYSDRDSGLYLATYTGPSSGSIAPTSALGGESRRSRSSSDVCAAFAA